MFRMLHDLSFSRSGIVKSCTVLVLIGIIIAGITGTLLQLATRNSPPPPDMIENIYQSYTRMMFPERVNPSTPLPFPLPGPLERVDIREASESWTPILAELAKQDIPVQGSRFLLGLHELYEGDPKRAIDFFHQENLNFPHPRVRRCELEATLRARDADHLTTLGENPAYKEELTPGYFFHMGILTENREWILRWFWSAQYAGISLGVLLLVLIAGGIWCALLLSLFPIPLRNATFLWAAGALILGAASTWPTVLSGIWLDGRFDLTEGHDFLSALLYNVVSVGIREEFCKLLLFTPFLFWVLKPGRDLEALIFGAMVGLGFAIEENMNYFSDYAGNGVVVSRFVSANFLHLTLTGVNALALTRAIRDPQRWTVDAVQTLAMTIGLHGLYNGLLSQPVTGFGDMSYFSGAALAGCGFLFFREIPGLSSTHGLRLSRTALFCWGFCLLFNLELLSTTLLRPFDEALYITGNAALSSVLIGYIFLHQIQEPLRS